MKEMIKFTDIEKSKNGAVYQSLEIEKLEELSFLASSIWSYLSLLVHI